MYRADAKYTPKALPLSVFGTELRIAIKPTFER